MRDNRQRQGNEQLPSLQTGSAGTSNRMRDASSTKLTKLATNLGNDEVQKRLEKGNASRDEMLKFLVDRLAVVRDVQLREVALCNRQANWDFWRLVQNQGAQIDKPDPTRWCEVGKLYEQAAYHLCRGDLARGAAEMKRATEAEQSAFNRLTRLVETTERERTAEVPAVVEGPGAGAGACPMPEGVDVATQIQNVTENMPRLPDLERTQDPWWTDEEEEEEDGKKDGKGEPKA
jgi:hypothetical protein